MIGKFYERLCKGFAEIIPKKTLEKSFNPELEFAGIKEDHSFWLGKKILLSLLIGAIGFLIPFTIGGIFGLYFETNFVFAIGNFTMNFSILQLLAGIFLGIVFFAITIFVMYIHLFYLIDGRASLVENILPDFLMLVASNINAGMTPFSAFRAAARKEFGPLSEEIRIATSKALGTESFTSALLEVAKKIKSKSLEESVAFFNQSIRSGGHLTKLLETSANSLRETQEMRKELISSTKMYVVFVVFVVIIASPLLLAVSVQFLKMINDIQDESNVPGDSIGNVSFLSSKLLITPEFMQTAAYLLLFINSLLSSLFIGVLSNGKAKSGFKTFPLILIGSITFFLIALGFLDGFFAGF